MDQETKWRQKYEEVKDFVEKNHRNPSKHDAEVCSVQKKIPINACRMKKN